MPSRVFPLTSPRAGLQKLAETLRAQSAFLDDLWKQVAAGKKAGKTVDDLLKEVDLSKHGDFAADPRQNQSAIRQVFRKVS